MPTNLNIAKLSNRLEQIRAEVEGRLDRSTPEGADEPSAELFKSMNPDIEVSLGEFCKQRAEEYALSQKQLEDYREADTSMKDFTRMVTAGKEMANKAPLSVMNGEEHVADMFLASDDFKAVQEGKTKAATLEHDVKLKSLFATDTTGAASSISVESVRTGDLVMAARTRVTLLDVVPQIPTTERVVKYEVESVNESNVAPVAQGAVYLESNFRYDESSVNVGKIGAFINVSEEALDDVADLRSRMDGALRNQMLRRIQSDIIGGAPIPAAEYVTAPSDNAGITGFTQVTGINTIDGATINPFTVLEQAGEVIYRVGEADADAIVMNSQDWVQVATLQSTTGSFVVRGALSGVADPINMTLNGLPVILCNALPVNTALVGAFRDHSVIRDKQSVQVRIQEAPIVTALNSPTSPSGRFNIYTDARYAFYVRRPAGFCTITNFGQ